MLPDCIRFDVLSNTPQFARTTNNTITNVHVEKPATVLSINYGVVHSRDAGVGGGGGGPIELASKLNLLNTTIMDSVINTVLTRDWIICVLWMLNCEM